MANFVSLALFAALPVLILSANIEVEPAQSRVYVAEGDGQTLKCSYVREGAASDLKLMWEPPVQNGDFKEVVQKSESMNNKLTLIVEIMIEDFKQAHDGKWTCKLMNTTANTKTDESSIFLSLLDVERRGDTFHYGDESVSVNCGISTRQQNKYKNLAKWMKDGEDLDTSTGSVYQRNGDAGNLTISPATREHAGEYVAVYEIGDSKCSDTVPCVNYGCTVAVNADPFVKDFDKSKNLIEEENMKLQCGVLGYPKPVVAWYKDGAEVDPTADERITFRESNGFPNSEINIKGVKFEDAGDYKCVASSPSNTTLKAEKQIVVRVKDKLAALWPFLGIVGEVIILCTIIFIYEKRRSKQASQADANAHEATNTAASDNAEGLRHRTPSSPTNNPKS